MSAEAVKAAADAGKSGPTSFAPSAAPAKPSSTGGGQTPSGGGPAPAAESKAQPTASTPSAAELAKAAAESRISQGASARCGKSKSRLQRACIR